MQVSGVTAVQSARQDAPPLFRSNQLQLKQRLDLGHLGQLGVLALSPVEEVKRFAAVSAQKTVLVRRFKPRRATRTTAQSYEPGSSGDLGRRVQPLVAKEEKRGFATVQQQQEW